jgi:hypothetical protein
VIVSVFQLRIEVLRSPVVQLHEDDRIVQFGESLQRVLERLWRRQFARIQRLVRALGASVLSR